MIVIQLWIVGIILFFAGGVFLFIGEAYDGGPKDKLGTFWQWAGIVAIIGGLVLFAFNLPK